MSGRNVAEDIDLRFCDHCVLGFHKVPGDGTEGCDCLGHGCGCRIKREAAK